jgi:hypothetical protein
LQLKRWDNFFSNSTSSFSLEKEAEQKEEKWHRNSRYFVWKVSRRSFSLLGHCSRQERLRTDHQSLESGSQLLTSCKFLWIRLLSFCVLKAKRQMTLTPERTWTKSKTSVLVEGTGQTTEGVWKNHGQKIDSLEIPDYKTSHLHLSSSDWRSKW